MPDGGRVQPAGGTRRPVELAASSPAPWPHLQRVWNDYGVSVQSAPGGWHGRPPRRRLRHRPPRPDPSDPQLRPGSGRRARPSRPSAACRLGGPPGPTAVSRRACAGRRHRPARRGRPGRSSSWRVVGGDRPSPCPRCRPRSRRPRRPDHDPGPVDRGPPHGPPDDPANTFYQLFERAAGASTWSLATPPGVADNGGLVVGPSVDGSVTAGLPPLGRPDVLRPGPPGAGWDHVDPGRPARRPGRRGRRRGHRTVRSDGGGAGGRRHPRCVAAAPGVTTWHPLVTAAHLTAAGARMPGDGGDRRRRHRLGSPMVGDALRRTPQVGLFVPRTGGRCDGARPGGPRPVDPGGAATGGHGDVHRVLRLDAAGPGVAGLVGTPRARAVGRGRNRGTRRAPR